ncbi:hypothetical protein [Halorientalis litorea]|uniref:hypothetical protein n=1 Tax=Halorientalis litorea TaxID=2931977 RepID=UPI001FF25B3D|nr:hypothetical protein [Halorientalis litorea]
MTVGRLLGYALLGLVDAIVPALVFASVVHEIGLFVGALSGLWPVLAAAGVALALGSVVGFVAAMRGERPFPLTRAARRVWQRYLWRI